MRQPNVLELGSHLRCNIGAAYSAKLLADQGACVVKVEPHGGDPLRQNPSSKGLFLALNTSKQSVCLDLPSERDPHTEDDLRKWLNWADIVIHSFTTVRAEALGLTPDSFLPAYPQTTLVALTPFGFSGPYAHFAATELTLSNAGGWANLCPATHEDPTLPPLKVYGDQCQLMAGVSAATTAFATFQHAQLTGIGEFIDFSIQAYIASVLESALPALSYKEETVNRTHLRSLIPWRIFQAKDAPVFIVCVEQDQWLRLVDFMGNPDWASLESFADQPSRAENQDLVHTLVQEFISQWRAEDLYHQAQKYRICVAPVLDLKQLASNEHLHARAFFQTISHAKYGEVQYMSPAPLTTQGRQTIKQTAPSLGEHTVQATDKPLTPRATSTKFPTDAGTPRPLQGIRVLDLTWAWAGPFCSMNLAHLGAEVIRVESEKRADLYRRLPVYPVGIETGLNHSGMFNQWNQGKSSITVDLQTKQGIAIVKSLVTKADVVVQNFATGVMARLGLDYDTLKSLNPSIILASISGYGQSGPYKDYMGYGPAIPPLTGLAAATGYINGEAEEMGLSMPDPTAGITAAWAIVCALHQRQRTGLGEHIDISLWEATAVLNAEGWMNYALDNTLPERIGNRSHDMAPHGVFACQGDTADYWVAISVEDNNQWQRLARIIGIDPQQALRFATLRQRKHHEDELEHLLTAWCAQHDRWDITHLLQDAGIPAFPTLSTADIIDDPQLNQRHFIERLNHPEVGVRAHAGIPWLFARRVNGVTSPAPCLDADTDRLLATLLDYDETTLTQLRVDKIIGC